MQVKSNDTRTITLTGSLEEFLSIAGVLTHQRFVDDADPEVSRLAVDLGRTIEAELGST